jgi:hypothetical protein
MTDFNCCVNCHDRLPRKFTKKHIEYGLYEIQFIEYCAFCRYRMRKIKRLQQQICDLQWTLFCMK